MKKTIRLLLRTTIRLSLWCGAILLLIAVIMQIAITGGIIWLGSANGKIWVQEQIANTLKDTGYTVSYQDLYYTADRGFWVKQLTLSDTSGPMLQADYAAIKPAFLPILERRLSLSLEGGTIDLERLPVSNRNTEQAPSPTSITIPIYFRSISLDSFHIAHLQLGEKILGQRMALEPHLKTKIILNKSIDADLTATLDQIDGTDIAWLPQTLNFQGTFDPATTQIAIRSLNIKAPAYAIEGKGSYAIAPAQPVDLQLSAAIDHLDRLAKGMPGKISLNGSITGTADALAFNGNGKADLDLLKERGLDIVDFKADIPSLNDQGKGSLALTTQYKETPVTLSADLHYAETQLIIENLKGNAPDLDVSGMATLDTATTLLTGEINAKFDNLATYSDLAGIKLAGKGAVNAALSHPQDTQTVKLSATLDGIRYDTIILKHADGTATIADIKNPWPNAADLTAQGFNMGDAGIGSLKATLKKRDGGQDYHLDLNASGNYRQGFQISGGTDISNLEQAQPDLSNIAFTLKSAGNTLNLKGKLDAETINITADTTRFALRGLPLDIPEATQNFMLSGKASMTGALSDPVMTSNLHLNTGTVKTSLPVLDLEIIAGYKANQASANISGKGKGIKTLTANLDLPLGLSLKPFKFDMPQNTALNGSIVLNGDSSSLLGPFLPQGTVIGGNIDTKAKISGALNAPAIDGNILLSKGSLHDAGSGLNLANIDLNALFSQSSLTLKTLSAQDAAQGTIKGSGKIGFGKTATGQINLILDQFHTMKTDTVDAVVSGTLSLQNENKGYSIKGQIDPDQTSITIPERLQSSIPQLNIIKAGERKSSSFAQGVALDIKVKANNRVFVRGWGLDAEFGGDLAVNGTLGAPLIDGTLSSIRGRYDEFGRHFTLDHASLRFQGEVPPSPYLDIKADVAASDVVASVLITGPVKQPALSFVSTPSLPQDEVFSRILFGKNMSKISPFQAIQLEQSLSRFSGKGSSGFDPLGKLRSATGLDDISVDSDASGATTVGAGKYVTDKVYIGVQRGQSETSGAANIRVDVTPNIAVDSRVGQDAQGGAGVSWHWDY